MFSCCLPFAGFGGAAADEPPSEEQLLIDAAEARVARKIAEEARAEASTEWRDRARAALARARWLVGYEDVSADEDSDEDADAESKHAHPPPSDSGVAGGAHAQRAEPEHTHAAWQWHACEPDARGDDQLALACAGAPDACTRKHLALACVLAHPDTSARARARAACVDTHTRVAAYRAMRETFVRTHGLGELRVHADPPSTKFWTSRASTVFARPHTCAGGESWQGVALAYGSTAEAVASASRLTSHERTLASPRTTLLVPPARRNANLARARAVLARDPESGRLLCLYDNDSSDARESFARAAKTRRASARAAVLHAARVDDAFVGSAAVSACEYYLGAASGDAVNARKLMSEDRRWEESHARAREHLGSAVLLPLS